MAPQRIEDLDDTRRLQLLVEGVVDYALYTISLDGRSPMRARDFTRRGEARQGQICRRADRQTSTQPQDLTPRNKNECLAVVQTLNEQAKKLSRQTKQAVPPEFTRVATDLEQSCGARARKAVRSQVLQLRLHSVVRALCQHGAD